MASRRTRLSTTPGALSTSPAWHTFPGPRPVPEWDENFLQNGLTGNLKKASRGLDSGGKIVVGGGRLYSRGGTIVDLAKRENRLSQCPTTSVYDRSQQAGQSAAASRQIYHSRYSPLLMDPPLRAVEELFNALLAAEEQSLPYWHKSLYAKDSLL